MREKLSNNSRWLALVAGLGLVVLVANLHLPSALAGEDHVREHRYHRMTEAEQQELEESIESAMETVHEALEGVFEGLEIDVDLSDLDFSGLEDLHIAFDEDDFDFDFDSEEFSQRMEEFGERLSERMEALGERLEDGDHWNWSSRKHRIHRDRDSADIQSEIRELREKIDALERELSEQRDEEGI